MERKYVAIVRGPKEYLPDGFKKEELVITQEDIDEYLGGDDSETEEDAINYYKEEYISEWAQRWCDAQLLTEGEFRALYGSFEAPFRFENVLPLFDDDDGEEEEEDEWEDWK